jgi:NADH-quinone oxidoreductase subunit N
MLNVETYNNTAASLKALAPEIVLMAVAVAIMTAGAFLSRPRKFWARFSAAALIGSLVAWGLTLSIVPDEIAAVFINDTFSVDVRFGLLVIGLIIIGLLHDQVDSARAPEFFGSLLFVQAGAMIVAGSNDLVMLFLGLELVSLPTYLMLYLARRNATTLEAATKYFFLSIFASALFLYGLAFLYGQLGITQIKGIATIFHSDIVNVPDNKFALIAGFLIFAGLAYRIAAVPMHFYAPDVYEGSPYGMTALLSWYPKAVGFIALARLLSPIYGRSLDSVNDYVVDRFLVGFALIAAATLFTGNAMALLQTNLRRLLAYSSISHSGFLMLGFIASLRQGGPVGNVAADPLLGIFGILYYLAAYGLMTLGAVGVLISLNRGGTPVETIDDLAGLGRRNPSKALILAVFFFSMAGIPPLVGYWGKFYVFSALFSVATRESDRMLTWLAIFAAVCAAIGVVYYLRVIVTMYLKDSELGALEGDAVASSDPWPLKAAITGCLVGTLAIGFFPAIVSLPAHRSAVSAVRLPLTKQSLKVEPATASVDVSPVAR